MTEGRDVTIKAHELDRLLQLALAGNQMRSRGRNERLPAEAVERLQSLNVPQLRERATLADPLYPPLSMEPSMSCFAQSSLAASEELPRPEDDGEGL
jgi:hypothetical protein